MKRALLVIGLLAVTLIAVVLIRTFMFTPPDAGVTETVSHGADGERAAQRLAEAIRFRTVSRQEADPADEAAFTGFIDWLAGTYPEAHAAMDRTLINGRTILLRWEGRDASAQPALLTAHYDVVPVVPGTEDDWEQPPYAGVIADGFVWGRGSLDDKGGVIALMEAATMLLERGFTPRQTIYFSFGHDEEIGGPEGAAGVADFLKAEGVQLAWSLDEGSFILDGLVPGVDAPVAMINVAEKGYVSLELIARAEGGHSSMPPRDTAVTILAEALLKLRDNQMDGGLDGLAGETYGRVGRHLPFFQRMLFANQWLFGGMVESVIGRQPAGNAMMRTTTAPTMLEGSPKENVLPATATATINFRVHPRDTVADVAEHARRVIADDRIEIIAHRDREASPVASYDNAAYRAIEASTRRIVENVIVAPGLTIAGTDSKHYVKVSDNAYRFHPFIVTPADLPRIHGTNERISIENLTRAIDFYIELLMAVDEGEG